MRTALLQVTSSDDPASNAALLAREARAAAMTGAGFICTPEVSNCVSLDRAHQSKVLTREHHDLTLMQLRAVARDCAVWIALGSVALRAPDDRRFLNRSILITPQGKIAARYDKIHMFDVDLGDGERFRESAGYRPGDSACVAVTPFATLGLAVCYDLRFPALSRTLAQAGADVLLFPSAFAIATGRAHWETLLRARAIECGAWVIAAAQCGTHPASAGPSRQTWGHSLVVSPWGEIVARAGSEPVTLYADINTDAAARARIRIPALAHDRTF